jgi:DNA-binding MarR family transcriptional regulator
LASRKIVASALPDGPPFVGALLRLCWQRARARIREAVREAGFTDLQEAQLLVFSYPPPDGVRPSELARRLFMSRQAANHVIQQMETLGYLERRAPEGGERRLVYLTPRGWAVGEVIIASMRALQAEWAEEIGAQRFAEFVGVLKQLAAEPAR